jgi:chromosome segregation protein
VARIDEVLSCVPQEAAKIAELKPGAPSRPRRHRRPAQRYRQERERLGGVNLRAEEEANETGARATASSPSATTSSPPSAGSAMRSAASSREGRERLLAFDTVNGHFTRLFTHLFGGGRPS